MEHIREARKCELALHAMLGTEDGGYLRDALYYSRYESADTVAELDKLLLREGISVTDGND